MNDKTDLLRDATIRMMADVNPIRWWRKRLGMRAEELATKAGLSSQSIWKIEKGSTAPRIDTLYKIAGVIEADPASLIHAYQNWLTDRRGFSTEDLIQRIAPTPDRYADMVQQEGGIEDGE